MATKPSQIPNGLAHFLLTSLRRSVTWLNKHWPNFKRDWEVPDLSTALWIQGLLPSLPSCEVTVSNYTTEEVLKWGTTLRNQRLLAPRLPLPKSATRRQALPTPASLEVTLMIKFGVQREHETRWYCIHNDEQELHRLLRWRNDRLTVQSNATQGETIPSQFYSAL